MLFNFFRVIWGQCNVMPLILNLLEKFQEKNLILKQPSICASSWERKRGRLLKKRKWKSFLELEKRGDCYLTCISCYFIYLFLLHVFVSSFYSEHNCHELTSLGTFAYAVGVPCEPVHSIWLALLCLNCATEKRKFRWIIGDYRAYFWAFS